MLAPDWLANAGKWYQIWESIFMQSCMSSILYSHMLLCYFNKSRGFISVK